MSVVTPAEVITYLKLDAGEDQAYLQGFIDSAVTDIGLIVGPLEATPITEKYRPRDPQTIVFTRAPVLSITSITSLRGNVVDPAGFFIDNLAGVAYSPDNAPLWEEYYTLIYSAGRTSVPPNLRTAVLELIRDDWEASQLGGGAPAPRQSPPATEDDLPSTVRRHLHKEIELGGIA